MWSCRIKYFYNNLVKNMSLKCKNLWAMYMLKGNFEVLIQAVAPCKAVYFAWVSFFPLLCESSMEFILWTSCRLWREEGIYFVGVSGELKKASGVGVSFCLHNSHCASDSSGKFLRNSVHPPPHSPSGFWLRCSEWYLGMLFSSPLHPYILVDSDTQPNLGTTY